MTTRRTLTIAATLLTLVTLSGCATTGNTSAAERRTAGTVVEDNSIELKAREAIYTNDRLKKQVRVNVDSFNGVVLLTGEAPATEMSEAIVGLVQQIPKVRQIHNEIAITPPASLADRSRDSWITTKVKTRHIGNKEVNGLSIKVITVHGIVYLMGIVSQSEGEAATNLARQVDGVAQVVKMFEYQ